MKLFDFHHPFFAPLWIRIVVVAFCLGWGLFEFAMGGTLWGVLFCGVGALAIWQFFVRPADHWNGPPGQD